MSTLPEETPENIKSGTPPNGDLQKAEKYVAWLCDLISKDKLTVNHSDLKKFDLTCMEDHYRVDLGTHDVEISHSKHPETSADMFTMLFNTLHPRVNSRSIIAFVYLTKEQFLKFKVVADDQIERIRKAAEEKRFKQAMGPIDNLLEQVSLKETGLSEDDRAAEEENRPSFFEQPVEAQTEEDQETSEPEQAAEDQSETDEEEAGQSDEATGSQEEPTSEAEKTDDTTPTPPVPEPTSATGKVAAPQSSTPPTAPAPDSNTTEPEVSAPVNAQPVTRGKAPAQSSISDQLREAAMAAGLPIDDLTPASTTAAAPPASSAPGAQAMGISEPTSAVFPDEAPQPPTGEISSQNIYLTGDSADQPIPSQAPTAPVTSSAPAFNPAAILNPDNITPLNPATQNS